MSSINAHKVKPGNFSSAPSSEVYNIHEMATLLRTTAAGVRQMVKAGTVPQPLLVGRSEARWTKAMLTAAGITSAKP